MLNQQTYVILSLQTHIFHSRQMKEHAIFIEATLPHSEKLLILEADEYKKKLENLLAWAVRNGMNIVPKELLDSHELVTEWTLDSEEKTSKFTGIAIDFSITKAAEKLKSETNPVITQAMAEQMKFINTAAIKLLDSFINFQEEMRVAIISCEMFSNMYVTMLEHIMDEAKWYRSQLTDIEKGIDIRQWDPKKVESFWTRIMRDHAAFIRGLLDPSQIEEIEVAHEFVKEFNLLLERLSASGNVTKNNQFTVLMNEIKTRTKELQEFKATATKAIDECKLKSIILPLVADHVLREANHFLRLLNTLPQPKQ